MEATKEQIKAQLHKANLLISRLQDKLGRLSVENSLLEVERDSYLEYAGNLSSELESLKENEKEELPEKIEVSS